MIHTLRCASTLDSTFTNVSDSNYVEIVNAGCIYCVGAVGELKINKRKHAFISFIHKVLQTTFWGQY